ncbi:MAG: TRAP transporter substrate-binding protein [Pseudomonadota bacterium]
MTRLAVLFALFLALPAVAAERLVVTSQYGPGKPQTLFWDDFAKTLEAERPGAFDVRIVIGGALGGEKEEAEGVRLGTISGALSTVANLSTWVPLGAVLDLPFQFDGPAHIDRALAGPLGQTLVAAYADEGFYVPAFITFGARHLIGPDAFAAPGEVSGRTMRVLQSDLHVALWRHLGARPTALPITEAYAALSRGAVDMMDMTMSGYEALKLHEVAPVLSETAHIWAIGVVYFDAAFIASLSDGDRALIDRAAREAAAAFNARAQAEQAAAMARVGADGARAVAVDRAPWRAALSGFGAAFLEAAGVDGGENALTWIEAARDGG